MIKTLLLIKVLIEVILMITFCPSRYQQTKKNASKTKSNDDKIVIFYYKLDYITHIDLEFNKNMSTVFCYQFIKSIISLYIHTLRLQSC